MLQNNVLGDAKGKKGSAAGRFWVKSALRCGRWRLVPREPDMLQIAQRAHSAARDTVEHADMKPTQNSRCTNTGNVLGFHLGETHNERVA